MVCSLLVTSGLVMLGCFPMVASGMRQMFLMLSYDALQLSLTYDSPPFEVRWLGRKYFANAGSNLSHVGKFCDNSEKRGSRNSTGDVSVRASEISSLRAWCRSRHGSLRIYGITS